MNFAHAEQPPDVSGIIITGPFMLPEQLEVLNRICEERGNKVEVFGFVPEPTQLLQHARCVVTMGGYNTVNEVISFQRDTLIVPRIRPRLEQLVRAQSLAEKGYVDWLHPTELTPAVLSRWLASHNERSIQPERPLDINGLARLVERVQQLIEHQVSFRKKDRPRKYR